MAKLVGLALEACFGGLRGNQHFVARLLASGPALLVPFVQTQIGLSDTELVCEIRRSKPGGCSKAETFTPEARVRATEADCYAVKR